MASRVSALLLLGVICFGFAAGEMVLDCCLRTSGKYLPLHLIESYSIQVAGKGCDISAIVFITKTGKKLCLSSNKPWMQSHIEALERRGEQQ